MGDVISIDKHAKLTGESDAEQLAEINLWMLQRNIRACAYRLHSGYRLACRRQVPVGYDHLLRQEFESPGHLFRFVQAANTCGDAQLGFLNSETQNVAPPAAPVRRPPSLKSFFKLWPGRKRP